jgi:SAM-dependent methyltransferase
LDLAHGIKLSKTTPAQTGSLNHNPSESKISDQVGNDIRKKVQDDINFYNFDLLLEDWPAKVTSQKYDLVVAFGLLHHVPRLQLRRQFLQQAAALLTNAGQFIFTTWRFNHIDRLRKRIVEPGSDEFKHFSQAYGLDEGDLDLGDYILNWVKKELAYRYSHDYSRQEIEELVADAGLQLVDSFRADGRTEDQNEYFVCQKKHPQTGA